MIGLGKLLFGDDTKISGYDPSSGIKYGADGKTLDTSFMNDQQWADFNSKGGIINDANKLELDGVEIGSEGLIGKFNNSGLGNVISTGKGALDLFTVGNDLFGSGKKDRKEAKSIIKQAFQQEYDINQEALNKFREDNARFKQDRQRITSSYMGGN